MPITKKKKHFSGAKTFWVIQKTTFLQHVETKSTEEKTSPNTKQMSSYNFSTPYTKIPHDKRLDILFKVLDFVFKVVTRDYIIINKQGCASWPSNKRGHHFIFTKSLLKRSNKVSFT